jgi:hypothetical protein
MLGSPFGLYLTLKWQLLPYIFPSIKVLKTPPLFVPPNEKATQIFFLFFFFFFGGNLKKVNEVHYLFSK